MSNLNNKPCPCGSELSYKACCRPLHIKKNKAITAEVLMRSRFSAYFLAKQKPELSGYILSTWCQHTRPAQMDLSDQPDWIRLEIHATHQGLEQDQQGWLEFTAYYRQGLLGPELAHREKSRFNKNTKGQWCYQDGVEP
ncbi:SEC-C domain-containing protein [Thiomicrospira microaerophila]|uniref:YchJ family protein n=1 Tax=Thiomicrospira microaerophila TaxID=406020 RepID=UPI00200F4260|nr:YchJ family metal-binding protein [Thiomicrospira microaerophila]UQB43466.1 SEC-C domain-containing protein [Thiomicrospira microaerophila]